MSDLRHRFIFDTLPVRGLHVQLDSSFREILSRKAYPPAIQSALGELLAAGALLSSNLKMNGTLTLQVQPRSKDIKNNGLLRLLVVECNAEQHIRATARWDEHSDKQQSALSLTELFGSEAVFVLTFQPVDGEAWQGIVPLEGASIADALMHYMMRSEQLETHLTLYADENHCAGLLLQRLPEVEPSPEAWDYVTALANTVTRGELLNLPADKLLYRLYHETPPRLFAPDTLSFACTCNEEKIARTLRFLGAEEIESIIAEQGKVQLDCDFCHRQFSYSADEARKLLQ